MCAHVPIEATVVFLISRDRNGDEIVLLGWKSPQASFAAGKLVQPGGKCNPGESYVDCAVREYREETGIILNVSELEFVVDFMSFHEGAPFHHVMMYVARSYTGEVAASSEMSPEWFLFEKIPYDEMLEGDDEWVPRVLRGEHLIVRKYMYKEIPSIMEVSLMP